MDCNAIEVVHPERTAKAGCVLRPCCGGADRFGIEHRVVDDQLAAPFESVVEGLFPSLTFEGVFLLDELPGEVAALSALK